MLLARLAMRATCQAMCSASYLFFYLILAKMLLASLTMLATSTAMLLVSKYYLSILQLATADNITKLSSFTNCNATS